MKEINTVVLAAGQGKRMRSDLPKVLQPLAGKALLKHVLDTLQSVVKTAPTVVVGHGAEIVKTALEGRDVRFALQSVPRGTGDALRAALSEIDMTLPRTVVTLGDVPLVQASTYVRLIEGGADDEVVILSVKLDNPTGYGRLVRDAQGSITGIVEEKDASPEERLIQEVNTGIMRLPTSRLEGWLAKLSPQNAQGEYYLTDVIKMAVEDGVPVRTEVSPAKWEVEGVNSKVQLAQLEREYQYQQALRLLEAGVTVIDPARVDIRGTVTAGRDTLIDVNTVFEGTVVLGDRVTIGPNCLIKDCVIENDTTILAMSHLDGAKVGADSRIGPFARLRPGAELAGHNHIGNFVEIKKSTVGLKSKVNHLTYIGDSQIGERVNVGAGVITCNYDGIHKHTTVIGDDAFIGSGCQLVAPVTIEEGALIGAGTTLTKTAKAYSLTLARSPQRTIDYPVPAKLKNKE